MVTLYAAREASTIVQVQEMLQEADIRYNIAQEGTAVQVRQQDISRAMVEVDRNLELAEIESTATGFIIHGTLENVEMGTPETTEIKRQHLQQGEIERMLREMQGVNDATVLINLADPNSIFLRSESSAAIFLATETELDRVELQTIVNIIVSVVSELTEYDISIMDQYGRFIFYDGEVYSREFVCNEIQP